MTADQAAQLGELGAWVQIALELRNGDGTCGDVAVHFVADQPNTVELGVTIAPRHQRNGFATEALETMMRWLFRERGTHRIFARTDSRNTGMRSVLQSIGMQQEAELRDADWFKGEWTTLCIYAALADEWVPRPTR